MGKVGKDEESVGRSGTGGSFKERTEHKGARKGRGCIGGRESKEEGEAGACGEINSVVRLRNEGKAGGCSVLAPYFTPHTLHFTPHTLHFALDTLYSTLDTLRFTHHTLHSTLTLHTLHFKLYT